MKEAQNSANETLKYDDRYAGLDPTNDPTNRDIGSITDVLCITSSTDPHRADRNARGSRNDPIGSPSAIRVETSIEAKKDIDPHHGHCIDRIARGTIP